MSLDADPFGLVGGTLDGKYDVERVVAEGGFGVVYRATHCGLRRPVAIKVLKTPSGLDPALRGPFLEKFAQEARLIADLDHPAIVRVIDFGVGPMPVGEVAPWMVLEWLDGTTLEDDMEARRSARGRSPAEALALLRPVLEALAVAHEAGIAHRDLKPANLMVVRNRRGEPALRVLDFGIAKVMGDEEHAGASGHTATQSRLQACSPPYAAPEQVSGTRTGPWTDVHALGLILTELLTDAPPYPGSDLTETYAAILSPTRPTPARVGVDVGPWEAVLCRAVAFRPTERFQSAGALLAALESSVPERRSAVALDESITTPRSRAPAESRTTLRPAEVRSQLSPRRSPRRAPIVVVAVLAILGSSMALVGYATKGAPAQGIASPSAVRAPVATPVEHPPALRDTPAPVTVVPPANTPNDAGAPRPLARRVRAGGAAPRGAVVSQPSSARAPTPAPALAPSTAARFIPAE